MKSELVRLFDEDQRERGCHPQYGTQDYGNLRLRDSEPLDRVLQIIGEIGLQSPEDRYHAAMILHHLNRWNDVKACLGSRRSKPVVKTYERAIPGLFLAPDQS